MKLSELAEQHTIKHIWVVDAEGDNEVVDWDDATREKFGDVPVRRIAQNMWESGWQTHQYPQETITYGLVVVL